MVAEDSRQPVDDLEVLAQARFAPLSQAELKLLRAAPKGEVAWCGPSAKDDDPANNPAKADEWDREREIRADLIRWLCVDRDAASAVDPRGIQIHAGRITGALDLSFVSVPFPLGLCRCRLTGDASLISADLPALNLAGSRVLSVTADAANVRGDVFLDNGFNAEGEVRLLGAQIGSDLDCSGGTFKNAGKNALSADGTNVKGTVFLDEGFSAEGTVRLPGAQIGGNLGFNGGRVSEVKAQNTAIRGTLFWRGVEATSLDLINASAGSLVDDEKSWPGKGNLLLDGFVYGHISGDSPRDAKTRLRWLERQEPFTPKPYRQLAKVLREAGDDSGARKVLFEMERRRRLVEDRRWCTWLWGRVLKWTIGYGFHPGWAVWGLLLLAALGWGLFRHGYFAGAMAPTDKDAYSFFRTEGRPPDYYQRFTASVYSLENSLPLVNLGQKDQWTPDPNPRGSRRMPSLLRLFRWGQVLLGWLLATLFVAGVTGVVRKE
jgi:hypothetical protein